MIEALSSAPTADQAESRLEAQHLQKAYGSRKVVHDVSISVKKGEVVGLLGPNGAGKTTLMRLLMGEMEPDSGKRTLYPGMRIGYLAQQVAFDPSETVASFVRGGLAGSRPTFFIRSLL